jgi:hypothetical protein
VPQQQIVRRPARKGEGAGPAENCPPAVVAQAAAGAAQVLQRIDEVLAPT